MDDKFSQNRMLFPPLPTTPGHSQQKISQFLKGSLIHTDPSSSASTRHARRHCQAPAQNISTLGLLWLGLHKPVGKTGTVILFLSWILLALAASAPILASLGVVGMMTGITLIGFSMFGSRSRNASIPNPPRGESINDGVITAQL